MIETFHALRAGAGHEQATKAVQEMTRLILDPLQALRTRTAVLIAIGAAVLASQGAIHAQLYDMNKRLAVIEAVRAR